MCSRNSSRMQLLSQCSKQRTAWIHLQFLNQLIKSLIFHQALCKVTKAAFLSMQYVHAAHRLFSSATRAGGVLLDGNKSTEHVCCA